MILPSLSLGKITLFQAKNVVGTPRSSKSTSHEIINFHDFSLFRTKFSDKFWKKVFLTKKKTTFFGSIHGSVPIFMDNRLRVSRTPLGHSKLSKFANCCRNMSQKWSQNHEIHHYPSPIHHKTSYYATNSQMLIIVLKLRPSEDIRQGLLSVAGSTGHMEEY